MFSTQLLTLNYLTFLSPEQESSVTLADKSNFQDDPKPINASHK